MSEIKQNVKVVTESIALLNSEIKDLDSLVLARNSFLEAPISSELAPFVDSFHSFAALSENLKCQEKLFQADLDIMTVFEKQVSSILKANESIKRKSADLEIQRFAIVNENERQKSKLYQMRQIENDKLESIRSLKEKLKMNVNSQVNFSVANSNVESNLVFHVNVFRSMHPRDVCGMLLSLVEPKDSKYTKALLTVLGSRSLNSIVVRSRSSAVKILNYLKNQNDTSSGFTIEILDEINLPLSCKIQLSTNFVPLFDVISILNTHVTLLFQKLFCDWYICVGDDASLRHQMGNPAVNIVCLDGRQYFADGEIRVQYSKSSKLQWPDFENMQLGKFPAPVIAVDEKESIEASCELEKNIRSTEQELLSLQTEITLIESNIADETENLLKLQNAITTLNKKIKTTSACPIENMSKYLENQASIKLMKTEILSMESLLRSKLGAVTLNNGLNLAVLLLDDIQNRKYLLEKQSTVR
jgi:chromosome segregation ATPase